MRFRFVSPDFAPLLSAREKRAGEVRWWLPL